MSPYRTPGEAPKPQPRPKTHQEHVDELLDQLDKQKEWKIYKYHVSTYMRNKHYVGICERGKLLIGMDADSLYGGPNVTEVSMTAEQQQRGQRIHKLVHQRAQQAALNEVLLDPPPRPGPEDLPPEPKKRAPFVAQAGILLGGAAMFALLIMIVCGIR